MLYAADAWAVVLTSLKSQCAAFDLPSAESFVRQAREYFEAADRAGAIETKPLLYYYSFLNLTKALALARGRPNMVGTVFHGIKHQYQNGETLQQALLQVQASSPKGASAYDELHHCLTGSGMPGDTAIRMDHILPQSLVGHRLWREAANRRERFLSTRKVMFKHNAQTQQVWGVMEIDRRSLRRSRRSIKNVLAEGELELTWRACASAEDPDTLMLEQVTPASYAHRAADHVMDVVRDVKPALWRTVTSQPPYRRYYLYFSPPGEARLHQLESVYVIMFFLGSLTRYRPSYLFDTLNGPFGAFLREFLATQPLQMLYGLACEFQRQEVSKAAVV